MYASIELLAGGRRLRGCVRTPEGSGPFPTVIFYHGFTVDKVGQMRLHELFARACVENGIACVRFDFYGCGESDGMFYEMTPEGELEQAEAIYNWTKQQKFAAAASIFLCGHSFGGVIAALLAPITQPRGLVLWAPAFTMLETTRLLVKDVGIFTQRGIDIGGLQLSPMFLRQLEQINVPERLLGYERDILLLQGSCDEKVPIKAVELCQSVFGERLQIVFLKGANHQFSGVGWKNEVYKQSILYIKERLLNL